MDIKELLSTLTPQEINKVLYHRENMNNPGVDSEGYPVTIYATGIQIPEGKLKGKFVSVPGFFDGKIETDEEKLWKKWKKQIEQNVWPIYNSGKELNKRDAEVHKIMDYDLQQQEEQNLDNSLLSNPLLN